MERALYQAIHASLLKAGIYDDDAPWLAALVSRDLTERFEVRTPEVPVHPGLRADLEQIARELPTLERQAPEYVADYILGRLEEKYRFTVRLDWYKKQSE